MEQERALERRLVGPGGLQGTVMGVTYPAQSRQPMVLVQLDDGRELLAPLDAVTLREDGIYYLDMNQQAIEQAVATRQTDTAAAPGQAAERIVLPVIAEEVSVEKRMVETGKVRVKRRVQTHEESIDEPLLREAVEVTRVPIDRFVDAPLRMRNEGDTIVIPVVEEVLVIEKRLRLTEEVRITPRRSIERHQEQVTLRKEDVDIERS